MSENREALTPQFNQAFGADFHELLRWRRDVRRFRKDPLPEGLLTRLLELTALAPSVGLSQPWRFVQIEDPDLRCELQENFKRCNQEALSDYRDEKARIYAGLKLSGMAEAPVQFAVFCDESTPQGSGLGQKTMPETRRYSVAMAIHTLWLAARAHGLGLGWVSILDPEEARQTLQVPKDWSLVAYLCLGYPEEEHCDPELERHDWERRRGSESFLVIK
jgi:5,6-dimethylbenzimidazole synthase